MTDKRGQGRDRKDDKQRLLTIPNLLTLTRFFGSFVLAGVAVAGSEPMFLLLYILLTLTDWLDGKLAIQLNQCTEFGARLDTFADAALYAALLFGLIWLRGALLVDEFVWIIPAILSYMISVLLSWRKFGRWPSYHTRAAKTCWLLVFIAVIALIGVGWTLSLEIAMVAVVLTNIEAMLITYNIKQWRADVTSLWHVLRDRTDRPGAL